MTAEELNSLPTDKLAGLPAGVSQFGASVNSFSLVRDGERAGIVIRLEISNSLSLDHCRAMAAYAMDTCSRPVADAECWTPEEVSRRNSERAKHRDQFYTVAEPA